MNREKKAWFYSRHFSELATGNTVPRKLLFFLVWKLVLTLKLTFLVSYNYKWPSYKFYFFSAFHWSYICQVFWIPNHIFLSTVLSFSKNLLLLCRNDASFLMVNSFYLCVKCSYYISCLMVFFRHFNYNWHTFSNYLKYSLISFDRIILIFKLKFTSLK